MGELHFAARVDARGLDASFTVAGDEVLAVVGPNGAGKSTIAAVIAGLLRPDAATVRLGGRTLTDIAGGKPGGRPRGISVPAYRRRVGLLLQDPLLFPHLNVLGNVEFAARRSARPDPGARARRWLADVDAAELAGRKPQQISGGQAQRVALARALASDPELLVLDEPLRGLDVTAAARSRAVLRRVLSGGRPAVLITHDLLDVLALADRVLVLEAGRVAEVGPVNTVLADPRSDFGARFAGVNLARGVITGPELLETARGRLWHGTNDDGLEPGQSAVAVFSPSVVSVFLNPPQGSPRNCVSGEIAAIEVNGPVVRVRTGDQDDGTPGLAADITAQAAADLRLAVGDTVWFTVKTQGVGLRAAGATPAASQ